MEVDMQNPAEVSVVVLPSRPKRGPEADEEQTSAASVVILPLRPKRGSSSLVAQDHMKIPIIAVRPRRKREYRGRKISAIAKNVIKETRDDNRRERLSLKNGMPPSRKREPPTQQIVVDEQTKAADTGPTECIAEIHAGSTFEEEDLHF
ncbi:hypothetical protein KC367_g29 [Hortaea werneckii]|nr:hypothetical protein KC367_g29 [Hortaea werneckii]